MQQFDRLTTTGLSGASGSKTHSVKEQCRPTLHLSSNRKLVDYTVSRGPSFPCLQLPSNSRASAGKSLTSSKSTTSMDNHHHQETTAAVLPRRVKSLEVFPTKSTRIRLAARQETAGNEERVEFMFRIQPRQRNRTLSSSERMQEVSDAISKKTGKGTGVAQRKPRKPVLFPKECRSSLSSTMDTTR